MHLVEYIHTMPKETHTLVLDNLLGPNIGPKFGILFESIFTSFACASAAADDSLLLLLASKLKQFSCDIKGIIYIFFICNFLLSAFWFLVQECNMYCRYEHARKISFWRTPIYRWKPGNAEEYNSNLFGDILSNMLQQSMATFQKRSISNSFCKFIGTIAFNIRCLQRYWWKGITDVLSSLTEFWIGERTEALKLEILSFLDAIDVWQELFSDFKISNKIKYRFQISVYLRMKPAGMRCWKIGTF